MLCTQENLCSDCLRGFQVTRPAVWKVADLDPISCRFRYFNGKKGITPGHILYIDVNELFEESGRRVIGAIDNRRSTSMPSRGGDHPALA